MKTLTIILFATLSLTSGCATDTDYSEGDRGLRPGHKPSLDSSLPDELGGSEARPESNDTPAVNESFEIGAPESTDPVIDDGRVMWAEDVIRSGVRMTLMHHLDLDTGIDEVSILDEDGRYMTAVTTRYTPIELDVDGPK